MEISCIGKQNCLLVFDLMSMHPCNMISGNMLDVQPSG
jgi:hypothetical protein